MSEPDEEIAAQFPGLLFYEEFLQRGTPNANWPEIAENQASSLCYTSGTTGNPKGVLYSHRSTVLHALVAAQPDALNLSARDVVMPVVPMFHVNAWGYPTLRRWLEPNWCCLVPAWMDKVWSSLSIQKA